MNIKGFIFDMDGVVMDSMAMWRGLAPELAGQLGIELDDETNRRVQVMSLELSSAYLVERFGLDVAPEEIAEMVNKRITAYYTMQARLKEGVYDLMPLLRTARMKVCLATATPKGLARTALNKCDVAEYFPKIITVGEIGKGKSEPDIFEAALAYLGTKPEETLVVEDSEIAIKTAHDMGLKTCAVYDGVNDTVLDTVADATDLKIRSLSELAVLAEG